MNRPRHAFTLIETIIAAGLFLLLLGFFVPIMRICWQAWHRGGNMQTVQRDTLALSFRLRRDFSASRPESLVVQKTGSNVLLAFLSYEAVQGTETVWNEKGEVLWRKWVEYYFESAKQTVRRREIALTTPSVEPNEPVPPWNSAQSSRVAGHVTQFQVSSLNADLKLKIYIVTQEETASSATQITALPGLYALDTLGY